ncbi:hypothetical protein KC332_g60 [Hortaea werneckii]|nr:hypothetical protein KC332_g60 [Hortaea werneckii]
MLHQSKTASLAATSSSNAYRTVSRIALDLIDCRQVGATPAYVFHIPHFLLSLLQLLTQVQHPFHRLPPFNIDVAITRATKQADSLHFGHLIVPASHVCADQLRLLIIYESLGLNAAFPESSPRTARNDNIRHSLAILRFSPRITEHSLGRNESTGRRRAFVRVGAKFDLLREAKVLNAYTALHDFCTLLLKVLFHLTQVAAAEQQFQSLLFDLLFCWGSISLTGRGFISVTCLEISSPMRKASSFSVRCCPQSLNMASARRKTQKYNHSCCNVLSSLSTFIPLLTMTLVSRISPSIFASKDFRMLGLTYIIPFVSETHFVCATPIDYAAKASRVAVVVRNHDTWIKTLKVQYQKWGVVESTLGLHDQRTKLSGFAIRNIKLSTLNWLPLLKTEKKSTPSRRACSDVRGINSLASKISRSSLVRHNAFSSLRIARQTLIVCLPVIRTVDVCVKPQRSASLPKRPCDCAFIRENSSGRLNSYTKRARSIRYPQLLL